MAQRHRNAAKRRGKTPEKKPWWGYLADFSRNLAAVPAGAIGRFTQSVWRYRAALFTIFLLGGVLRLGLALDEDSMFNNHADEATYFNQAQSYANGPNYPLAHGGSGLPLLLSPWLSLTGHDDADPVEQKGNDGFDAATVSAGRSAYGFLATLSMLVPILATGIGHHFWGRSGALAVAGLTSFDPFLVSGSAWLMTDPLFVACILGAFWMTLLARKNTPWLYGAVVPLAFASMLRANGIVVFAAFVVFWAILWRKRWNKQRFQTVAGAIIVFFLLLSPYLFWRAEYLPGAFDYGTNGRSFTDSKWDFSDDYWSNYSYSQGGPEESLGDYLQEHGIWHAMVRLLDSIRTQFMDIFGAPGSIDGYARAPAIGPPLLVALVLSLDQPAKRRDWFPVAILGSLMALLLWVYPTVRSPRYYMVMTPLAAIWGFPGLRRLFGGDIKGDGAWRHVVASLFVGYLIAVYGLWAFVRFVEDIANIHVIGWLMLILALAAASLGLATQKETT